MTDLSQIPIIVVLGVLVVMTGTVVYFTNSDPTNSTKDVKQEIEQEAARPRPTMSAVNENDTYSLDPLELDDDVFTHHNIFTSNSVPIKITKILKIVEEYIMPVVNEWATWFLGLPPGI